MGFVTGVTVATTPIGFATKTRLVSVSSPIIPRDLRFEIPERIDASGRIVRPIDDDAVNAVGQKLLSSGVESVVVHFLHSSKLFSDLLTSFSIYTESLCAILAYSK